MNKKSIAGNAADYLRSFNRLTEQYQTQHQTSQLKLQQFHPYPIHKYFQSMESIKLQTKFKKDNQNNQQPQTKNQQLAKIDEFIRDTLKRMIQDNNQHIKLIQNSKRFYLQQSKLEQRKPDLHVKIGEVGLRKRTKSSFVINSNKMTAKSEAAQVQASKLIRKPQKRPQFIPFKPQKKIQNSGKLFIKNVNQVLTSLRQKKVQVSLSPNTLRQQQKPAKPLLPPIELNQRGLKAIQRNFERISQAIKEKGEVSIRPSCRFVDYQKTLNSRLTQLNMQVQYNYDEEVEKKINNFTSMLNRYYQEAIKP